MNQISITPIKKGEFDEASKLCAAAFINTPLTIAAMGGQNGNNLGNLTRGMKMLLKAPGKVIVAKEGDLLVGVMRMVQWPDCQKSSPRGLVAVLGRIFGGQAFKNVVHFRKIWGNHDPKEPHWHLDPLCVLPGKQGNGIGSQLLTYFCEQVDKDGILAYLETDQEQNERLYSRFGFRTLETEPIFGVTNLFMWRTKK